MKNLILGCFLSLFLFSCNSQKGEIIQEDFNLAFESESMPITRQQNYAPGEPTPPSAGSFQEPNTIKKKIIRDADVGVEVDNYKLFRVKIDSVIRTLNGYISNDNLYNNDQSINCNIHIRIPEQNFDKFLTYLDNGDAKILYKNISSLDVTEEFIDIEARLKNKRSIEKRYSQLLTQAKTISDILEIEEKLRVIREEIESTEGRLNYLTSQVSYSTIHLMITQKLDYKYEPSKGKNFFQLLIKSLDRGWGVFLQFLLFVFKLWPFIILIIVLIFTYYKFWKPKKERKHKKDK
ncbi:MAG: DUF4349 domain-containing protein [Bacteroidales bacterium]